MRYVDSHTEGEPTRVVLDPLPQLETGTMTERLDRLRKDWDHLRIELTTGASAPDAVVAAFLTSPVSAKAKAGVIFANAAGYLGMCGHGTIGVVQTLAHLGSIHAQDRFIVLDTPAGTVRAERFEDGSVEVQNVASYAYRLDVTLDVPEVGSITGDVAYGGNWFFLLAAPDVRAENIAELTVRAARIRTALHTLGITGKDGAEIDHIEFYGAPLRADADAKNFVLCPDGEYDRSPCGTGTSAKMALLYARRQLRQSQSWRQESITGSLFTGHIEPSPDPNEVIPYIRGRAFIATG